MYHTKRDALGFSLIELLLAMTIGLSLISLFSITFLSIRKHQQIQNAVHIIQENARVAFHFMKTDIQLAGYLGCPNMTENFPMINNTIYSMDPESRLMGTDHGFSIKHVELSGTYLIRAMRGFSTLYLSKNPVLKEGDIVIIADCKNAEIFKIKTIQIVHDAQKITTQTPLQHKFAKNTEVGRLSYFTYFIKNFALYRQDIHQKKIELVTGIKQMDVRYSIKEEGMVNERSALDVKQWSAVKGVSLCLLFVADSMQKNQCLYAALREAS